MKGMEPLICAAFLWSLPMPRTVTVRDDAVVLELDEARLGLLDRALSGYAKALQAARDMGVISHETFCGKADRTRAVQYLVWEAAERFTEAKRSAQPTPTTENSSSPA